MAAKDTAGEKRTRRATPQRRSAGTVQVNIKLDPELADRFRDGCARAGRTMQEVAAELFSDWLAREGL